jgi:hypothetical protein
MNLTKNKWYLTLGILLLLTGIFFGRDGFCRREPAGWTNPLVETRPDETYVFYRRCGILISPGQNQIKMNGKKSRRVRPGDNL